METDVGKKNGFQKSLVEYRGCTDGAVVEDEPSEGGKHEADTSDDSVDGDIVGGTFASSVEGSC